jgi:hypothetical protein
MLPDEGGRPRHYLHRDGMWRCGVIDHFTFGDVAYFATREEAVEALRRTEGDEVALLASTEVARG